MSLDNVYAEGPGLISQNWSHGAYYLEEGLRSKERATKVLNAMIEKNRVV